MNHLIFEKRLFLWLLLLLLLFNIPVFIFVYSRYAQKANPILKNKLHLTLRESYELSELIINQIKRDLMQKSGELIYQNEFMDYQRKYFNGSLTRLDDERFRGSAAVRLSGLDGIEFRTDNREEIFTYYFPNQKSKIQTLIRDSVFGEPSGMISGVRYFEQDQIMIAHRSVTLTNQRPGLLLTAMAVSPAISEPCMRIKSAYLYLSGIEQRDRMAIERRTKNLIVTHGVFFLLQIAVTALFAWRFGRPVRLLADETGMIAGQREEFHLSATKRVDDIGRIARSIQTIIHNASLQQQRMLDLEKMALWREIAQRLAHEIKNPLTPIQLTLQQIQDAYQSGNPRYPEILNECGTIIREELDRLRVLTKEFSEFARLPDFHYKPYPLNRIIRDVTALCHHARTDLDLDESIPDLHIDIDAIKRVFLNLIDNAVTAADPSRQAPISISTRNENECVIAQITDQGRGIPKENLTRIFEPHFSTKSSSMGLGLAIVKNILDHHNASIDVESVERSGTTFTIRFTKAHPLFSAEKE